MLKLKHDNQKSVIRRKKLLQKEKILNFRRRLHIITATQQDETFTKEICSRQILIKVKKLADVVHDESLSNRLIKFKMCVTTERDTESDTESKSNHMLIDIAMNEKRLQIMMNSNASENFIVTRYANYQELFIQRKNVVYRLLKSTDTTLNDERIKNEITIQLKICDITMQTTFDIVDLISYDVTLKVS